jgi:hypothetical protein
MLDGSLAQLSHSLICSLAIVLFYTFLYVTEGDCDHFDEYTSGNCIERAAEVIMGSSGLFDDKAGKR